VNGRVPGAVKIASYHDQSGARTVDQAWKFPIESKGSRRLIQSLLVVGLTNGGRELRVTKLRDVSVAASVPAQQVG